MPSEEPNTLAGRRVLIVEDEALLAFQVADLLEHLGCNVVGPAASAPRALRLLEAKGVDAAVLDVNLGDHDALPVADELARRGVPFAFTTAYGYDSLPTRFHNRPLLQKPFSSRELADILERAIAAAESEAET